MADILRVYDGTGKSIIVLAQGTDGGIVNVYGKHEWVVRGKRIGKNVLYQRRFVTGIHQM